MEVQDGPSSASLEEAVNEGIEPHGLESDPHLGVTLGNTDVGEAIMVESLDPETSDYYLVEVTRHGQPVAVAMVTTDERGFHFGALTPTAPGFRMPKASDAARSLGVSEHRVRAVWAPSPEARTPFDAIWETRDSGGRLHTVTMRGLRSAELPRP
jgi:hypothetical protein